MSLNRDQLESDILAAFKAAAKAAEPPGTPDSAQTTLARKLADAVNSFVRSAAVRGVQVDLTTGSPAAQTGDGRLE